MRKLKIGLFCDSFFPMIDGVVMVVDNYARRLQKYGEVTVFVPGGKRESELLDALPYPVISTPAMKVPVFDYPVPMPEIDYNFNAAAKKMDLDLLHIHSPFGLGKFALRYGRRNKAPVIATMHSQFRRDIQRFAKLESTTDLLLKNVIRVFDECEECWAVNAAVARIFYEEYGYHTLPSVQENGTDMMPLKNPDSALRRVNESYGIDPEETVFLFVGRLNKLKNVFLIADAIRILKTRGLPFKMLYVGSGQDEESLKQYIAETELSDRVIFTGRIRDRETLAALYARAALFLFPSLYDASSLVQIEAASQKTPTVFARGAATADTVTEGVNGFTAPADPVGFANTIETILADKERLRTVSENAYRDLYRSWDEIVDTVYGRYLDICDRFAAKQKQ